MALGRALSSSAMSRASERIFFALKNTSWKSALCRRSSGPRGQPAARTARRRIFLTALSHTRMSGLVSTPVHAALPEHIKTVSGSKSLSRLIMRICFFMRGRNSKAAGLLEEEATSSDGMTRRGVIFALLKVRRYRRSMPSLKFFLCSEISLPSQSCGQRLLCEEKDDVKTELPDEFEDESTDGDEEEPLPGAVVFVVLVVVVLVVVELVEVVVVLVEVVVLVVDVVVTVKVVVVLVVVRVEVVVVLVVEVVVVVVVTPGAEEEELELDEPSRSISM